MSSSIDEVRKRANEILKGVDQLIKAGKLDNAVQEIGRAKQIDPNNGYIRAFEERVAFLREEDSRKKAANASRSQMEDAARQKLDEERKHAEEERKKKDQEVIRRIQEAHVKRMEGGAPQNGTAATSPSKPATRTSAAPQEMDERRKAEEEARKKFEEEFKRAEAKNLKKAAEVVNKPAAAVGSSNEAHAMYKRVLLLAWADGALTPEEKNQLTEMRAALSISPQENEKLEREAKEESYAHAFELAWKAGLNVHERSTVIAELRAKFQLIPDIYSRLESKVLAVIDPTQQQPIIYVIDDEDEFLKLIARVLENAGFQVKAYNTSDDALKGLQGEMPHLILSDINLETSSAGGFTFYEKVRQLDHLLNVPFIFLSGMADEGMIRYGKGLGADDYLTKPFSSDMLLDTVKGKLKRFRAFRKN